MGCILWVDSDLYSARVSAVMYVTSCYIGLHYDGTRQYLPLHKCFIWRQHRKRMYFYGCLHDSFGWWLDRWTSKNEQTDYNLMMHVHCYQTLSMFMACTSMTWWHPAIKKNSSWIADPLWGNPLITSGFPLQRAGNALILWRTMCLWVFLSCEPGVSHSHFNLVLMGQLHHVTDHCHPSYFFSNQSSPTTLFTPGITKLHHQHSIIRGLGKCQDFQIYSYIIHGRSNDQWMHTSSVWVRQ